MSPSSISTQPLNLTSAEIDAVMRTLGTRIALGHGLREALAAGLRAVDTQRRSRITAGILESLYDQAGGAVEVPSV